MSGSHQSSQRSFGTIAILTWFYVVQGIPFGFQAMALPVILRRQGTSLELLGFVGLLALPWGLKMFFAPIVDRYWWPKLGRRRSWIIPCQILVACSLFASGTCIEEEAMFLLAVTVFVQNLGAAWMDVAVDGLAVDLLGQKELGLVNAGQVGGYKTGMLFGGGIGMAIASHLGWQGTLTVMMVCTLLALALTPLLPESTKEEPRKDISLGTPKQKVAFKDILKRLYKLMFRKETAALVAFLLTYKMGERMADQLFKPFLVDHQYSDETIGLWFSSVGLGFSLTGSLVGGFCASKFGIVRTLSVLCALRILPLAALSWVAASGAPFDTTWVTSLAEHFIGGAVTTGAFALMMSRTDPKIGATHYTALATLEVWGRGPSAWVSGPIAANLSYSFAFGLAAILSLIPLFILPRIKKRNELSESTAPEAR